MNIYDRISLINFIEEMWKQFGSLLGKCFCKPEKSNIIKNN